MDGFINLLKPPGMTSSDAVVALRRRLPRSTKVGHMGTLDPEAAGVLVLAIGSAPRLFPYVQQGKRYLAQMTLGVTTDTQDACGEVVQTRQVTASLCDIKAALTQFTGRITQRPSPYSAIHIDGKRSYERARAGEEVQMPTREVDISDITLVGQSGDDKCFLSIGCSSGTYIRTLVHDIGESLGCGAHMSFLLRTQVGPFLLEDALTLEQMLQRAEQGSLEPLSMPFAIPHLPRADVDVSQQQALNNGNPIALSHVTFSEQGETYAMYMQGVFLGLALRDTALRVKALLNRLP